MKRMFTVCAIIAFSCVIGGCADGRLMESLIEDGYPAVLQNDRSSEDAVIIDTAEVKATPVSTRVDIETVEDIEDAKVADPAKQIRAFQITDIMDEADDAVRDITDELARAEKAKVEVEEGYAELGEVIASNIPKLTEYREEVTKIELLLKKALRDSKATQQKIAQIMLGSIIATAVENEDGAKLAITDATELLKSITGKVKNARELGVQAEVVAYKAMAALETLSY